MHHGSPDDADGTDAALGSYAARHDLGVRGPAREYYLVGTEHTPDPAQWQTEICWPISSPCTPASSALLLEPEIPVQYFGSLFLMMNSVTILPSRTRK